MLRGSGRTRIQIMTEQGNPILLDISEDLDKILDFCIIEDTRDVHPQLPPLPADIRGQPQYALATYTDLLRLALSDRFKYGRLYLALKLYKGCVGDCKNRRQRNHDTIQRLLDAAPAPTRFGTSTSTKHNKTACLVLDGVDCKTIIVFFLFFFSRYVYTKRTNGRYD